MCHPLDAEFGLAINLTFCPPASGEWRYETKSVTPGLNGKTWVSAVIRAAIISRDA
jgi:hypothetical protein